MESATRLVTDYIVQLEDRIQELLAENESLKAERSRRNAGRLYGCRRNTLMKGGK